MVALLKSSGFPSPQVEGEATPKLRLVPAPSPRLRLADTSDRRMFPRKQVTGQAQGRRLDHTLHARQHPRLTLDLRDVSVAGLSALSDAPLFPGERLAVAVPGENPLAGPWHALGRVVRCDASGTGYRVAIEFDALPAA